VVWIGEVTKMVTITKYKTGMVQYNLFRHYEMVVWIDAVLVDVAFMKWCCRIVQL